METSSAESEFDYSPRKSEKTLENEGVQLEATEAVEVPPRDRQTEEAGCRSTPLSSMLFKVAREFRVKKTQGGIPCSRFLNFFFEATL